MLTLAGRLRVDHTTVFRDVVRGDDDWMTTSTVYALVEAPRLGRDASGEPIFDFIWYRMPADTAGEGPPAAGGIVTLTVDLAPTAEERAAIAQRLPVMLSSEHLTAIDVRAVPFTGGTVQLAFAGETGIGDFVAKLAGSGPARLTGSQRATFIIEVSRDGAAVLWDALEHGRDVLHARYDLTFEHRLGDVELRVWCDARQAQRIAAAQFAAGRVDPASLRETLVAQHVAGTEITSERPLEVEHQRALEGIAAQVLEAALGDALLRVDRSPAAPDRTGVTAIEPYNESMTARLNLTFRESSPVEAHAVIDSMISIGRTREQLGTRVRQLDLHGGSAQILDVTVHCTVDFGRDLIDVVKVRLEYDATGPAGRVTRSGEVMFRDNATIGHFRTELAAPDRRSYRYEAEVFYRGTTGPTRLTYPPTDSTTLVLDLDQLGVLGVDVELGDVAFDRVRNAVVAIEHEASGQSKHVLLDATTPAAEWKAVIRDASPQYRYRASWTTVEGAKVEDVWQVGVARRLRLDAPPPLRVLPRRRVQLVAAGDFSALAQIIVDLRLTGTSDASITEFTFTGPGQTAVWQPLAASAELRYEVKRTIVTSEGTRRELPWRADDRPVLVVRDESRFDVHIITRLLDPARDGGFALLELEPGDGVPDDRATLVLRDTSDARWSFQVRDPESHPYRYRLTSVARTGERTHHPWQDADEGILVLRPPA